MDLETKCFPGNNCRTTWGWEIGCCKPSFRNFLLWYEKWRNLKEQQMKLPTFCFKHATSAYYTAKCKDMTSHWCRMHNVEKEEKEENTEIIAWNLAQDVKVQKKCKQELVWRGKVAKQMEKKNQKRGIPLIYQEVWLGVTCSRWKVEDDESVKKYNKPKAAVQMLAFRTTGQTWTKGKGKFAGKLKKWWRLT